MKSALITELSNPAKKRFASVEEFAQAKTQDAAENLKKVDLSILKKKKLVHKP